MSQHRRSIAREITEIREATATAAENRCLRLLVEAGYIEAARHLRQAIIDAEEPAEAVAAAE